MRTDKASVEKRPALSPLNLGAPAGKVQGSQNLIHQWFRVSSGYLLLLGLLGVFLRFLTLYPVEGLVYRNFLHAHSHIAFLGWIFNALFAGIVYTFVPSRAASYKLLFLLLQVSVIGMLISFPIQGYALYSITFSTLHIFLSWWFAAKVCWDLRQKRLEHKFHKHSISEVFIKWSLFFMVLSALGPFALGGIMAKGLAGTQWYQLAIYFYLHFQYDGWFSFALFGLFFWLLEKNNIKYNRQYARLFLWIMVLACIPAYTLSTLWTEPEGWIYAVAGIAAGVQVLALWPAMLLLWQIRKSLHKLLGSTIALAMVVSLVSYILKVQLQLASALPEVARMAYLVRNFTIGYLHLVFLGFVSFFLLAWFSRQGFLRLDTISGKTGLLLFLSGFILTELYLVGQPLLIRFAGEALPGYGLSLIILSLLMPAGTVFIWRNIKNPATKLKNHHES